MLATSCLLRACQILLDAGDTGLRAGLVLIAAGRARNTERGDDLVTDLDRDAAGKRAMSGSVASAAPLEFFATNAANALDASNRKIGPKLATV